MKFDFYVTTKKSHMTNRSGCNTPKMPARYHGLLPVESLRPCLSPSVIFVIVIVPFLHSLPIQYPY